VQRGTVRISAKVTNPLGLVADLAHRRWPRADRERGADPAICRRSISQRPGIAAGGAWDKAGRRLNQRLCSRHRNCHKDCFVAALLDKEGGRAGGKKATWAGGERPCSRLDYLEKAT